MAVTATPFGTTRDGKPVQRFLLEHPPFSAAILEYGATLQQACAPDRDGRAGSIIAGFDRLEDYEGAHPYLGSTVGRFANRLAGAELPLDGRRYPLAPNEGPNQLHGGPRGFHRAVWKGTPLESDEGSGVLLHHVSPDGDQGFPGRLDVSCRYQLTPRGELKIIYHAHTNRPTVVNLTNHAYWNLSTRGSILSHRLELHAGGYLEIDEEKIPTGRILPTAGTPLDFIQLHPVGSRIEQAGGYDNCFILEQDSGRKGAARGRPALRRAAHLVCPDTGRCLTVYTDRPGIQLYSAEGLNITAGGGVSLGSREALCLECQDLPDSPHHPEFPSTRLDPWETYSSISVYQMGVDNGF